MTLKLKSESQVQSAESQVAGTGDELTASVYTRPLTTDTLNSTLNASKVFTATCAAHPIACRSPVLV